jgi:CheY-like chemotaxis protein
MKKRVLIVDDEIDTLKLLKMIVEISGYEGLTTLNSLEALTMAQVEQPDVVLLDIMMPKIDGFQLCKMLRADPKTRNLPIIFVTAYNALDLEDRRLASGGDMVMQKPVGMDDLIGAIEKVQNLERVIPEDIKKASAGMTSMLNPFKVQVRPSSPPIEKLAEPPAAETPPKSAANPESPASPPPAETPPSPGS